MRQIIRTKQSGQALGGVLCLLGFAALLLAFMKAWPDASSSTNVFSALWSQVLNGQMNIGSFFVLNLVYLIIGGSVLLILGIVVLALSRQIFYVSVESTLIQCPYCRNQWKARRAMGWAECPFCRKFVHPQTVKRI